MSKKTNKILLFSIISMMFCGMVFNTPNVLGAELPNDPPEVTIDYEDEGWISRAVDIFIQAEDLDDGIIEIEFRLGSTSIRKKTWDAIPNVRWEFDIQGRELGIGLHSLEVIVTDDRLATTTQMIDILIKAEEFIVFDIPDDIAVDSIDLLPESFDVETVSTIWHAVYAWYMIDTDGVWYSIDLIEITRNGYDIHQFQFVKVQIESAFGLIGNVGILDITIRVGNFWDDVDYYALEDSFTIEVNSPPTITHPSNQYNVPEGTSITIIWETTDENPSHYIISINDVPNDPVGITTSPATITYTSGSLEIGYYEFKILVEDGMGLSVEDLVLVNVEDETDPVLVSSPDPEDFTWEYGSTGITLTWIVTDDYPKDFEFVVSGYGEIEYDWESAVPIIIEIDDYEEELTIGTHEGVMTIYDEGHNIYEERFTITVIEATPNTIEDLLEEVCSINDGCWDSMNKRETMIKKLMVVASMIDDGNYEGAYDKLLHDAKPKLTGLKTDENGVAWNGDDDGSGIFKNPWVICEDEDIRIICNGVLTALKEKF